MKLNFISTHTLTWSVTKILTGKANPTIDFNSHAHVERDQIPQAHHETRFNFNSHAHVERDNRVSAYIRAGEYFNSHAHVERDIYKS